MLLYTLLGKFPITKTMFKSYVKLPEEGSTIKGTFLDFAGPSLGLDPSHTRPSGLVCHDLVG